MLLTSVLSYQPLEPEPMIGNTELLEATPPNSYPLLLLLLLSVQCYV